MGEGEEGGEGGDHFLHSHLKFLCVSWKMCVERQDVCHKLYNSHYCCHSWFIFKTTRNLLKIVCTDLGTYQFNSPRPQ